ncbi:hypothetical protein Tco_0790801 [Tanacetum coccineum]
MSPQGIIQLGNQLRCQVGSSIINDRRKESSFLRKGESHCPQHGIYYEVWRESRDDSINIKERISHLRSHFENPRTSENILHKPTLTSIRFAVILIVSSNTSDSGVITLKILFALVNADTRDDSRSRGVFILMKLPSLEDSPCTIEIVGYMAGSSDTQETHSSIRILNRSERTMRRSDRVDNATRRVTTWSDLSGIILWTQEMKMSTNSSCK